MRETPRSRRLNDAVQEAIAFIIAEDIADPRLELVTVTGADVTKDLSVARVYVTAHGGEERYAEVLEGLESAKGRIRSLLARRVPMRQTPELRFQVDTSVDAGMRIGEALHEVPPTLAARREAGEDDAADTGMGLGTSADVELDSDAVLDEDRDEAGDEA